MSGIESPLGKVSYSSGTKKVLTVDDQTSNSPFVESDNFESRFTQEELEEYALLDRDKLKNSRKEAQIQRNRIPEGVKKRLEILTGIGRLTEDVVIENITFSIRSLKPKEYQEIVNEAAKKDLALSQRFELRDQTMARSIYKIDGAKIETILESNNIEDKVKFIQETLEESVVDYLHNKYQALLAKSKKNFNELGKTEEEVLENVKKS